MKSPTSPTASSRRSRQLPLLALLIVVACGLWGFNWWQERRFPAKRHLAAAQQYVEQGRGADAEREWKKAASLDPDDALTWELLGDYYIATQDWKAAVESLSKAQKLAPQTPLIDSRLAVSAARIDDAQTAERHAREAIKRDANDVDALGIMVTVLARSRADKLLQIEYLQRLVKLRPDNDQFLSVLSETLLSARRFQEAIPHLNRLVELAPDYALAYAMRGEARFNLATSAAQSKAAEADLRRALQLNARDAVSHLNLGRLLVRGGQAQKAIKHFEAVGNLPQSNPEYLSELAKAYQRLGDSSKAAAMRSRFVAERQLQDDIDALKSRLGNQPDNFEDNLKLGLLLLKSGKPLGAEKRLEKARRLRPNDARLQAALNRLENLYRQALQAGFVALQKRDYVEADKSVARAMLLRPRDPRTHKAVQQLERVFQASSQAVPTAPAPTPPLPFTSPVLKR